MRGSGRFSGAMPSQIVWALGIGQLACWGSTYYLIGAFGDFIVAEQGWSLATVHGGFTAALVTMGLFSPVAGRLIDRWGGPPMLSIGACLSAIGCVGLAASQDMLSYYLAWVVIGLGMRLSLYDAAFATLTQLGGAEVRRKMAQITLFGGLSSSVFWPLGRELAEAIGWRSSLNIYAIILFACAVTYLAIPWRRWSVAVSVEVQVASSPPSRLSLWRAALLYVAIVTLSNTITAGLSAHMIGLLAGLGLAAAAGWVSALVGVGQWVGRLGEVLFGRRISLLNLTLLASAALPLCFLVGIFSGTSVALAAAFALSYGAANGLLWVSRGALPLILFEREAYGTVVGRLLTPSFLLSAAAPAAYAAVIERWGPGGGLWLSILLAVSMAAAAAVLKFLYADREAQLTV